MRNEDAVTRETNAAVKSTMMQVIRKIGPSDAGTWEQAVFRGLTGHAHEEVDWDFEDNHAGYYLWIRTFEGLIAELLEDGHVRVIEHGDGKAFEAVEG